MSSSNIDLELQLVNSLPPLQRLALAYAPRSAQPTWLGYFALDARLGKVVRDAREPLIGQIRLAWWRDRLGEAPGAWPKGEPLLQLLTGWDGEQGGLAPVVDGWEVLLGEPPLAAGAFRQAAAARASGAAAVAHRLGHDRYAQEAAGLAQGWALADLATGVTNAQEAAVLAEVSKDRTQRGPLPRALRPIVVLHGLTNRDRTGMAQFLTALRLGIFGR